MSHKCRYCSFTARKSRFRDQHENTKHEGRRKRDLNQFRRGVRFRSWDEPALKRLFGIPATEPINTIRHMLNSESTLPYFQRYD